MDLFQRLQEIVISVPACVKILIGHAELLLDYRRHVSFHDGRKFCFQCGRRGAGAEQQIGICRKGDQLFFIGAGVPYVGDQDREPEM